MLQSMDSERLCNKGRLKGGGNSDFCLGRRNRIDFTGGLGASELGNRRGQVARKGEKKYWEKRLE